MSSLENKEFIIKSGKATVPIEKLEEEAEKIALKLMKLFKDLKQM